MAEKRLPPDQVFITDSFSNSKMLVLAPGSESQAQVEMFTGMDETNRKEFRVRAAGGAPFYIADINVLGVNGLDAAVAVVDTWYYLFLIDDSNGVLSLATLLSLSYGIGDPGGPPTLPAGYDLYKRIGALHTHPTTVPIEFIPLRKFGQFALYGDKTDNLVYSGFGLNPAAFTPVNVATRVPTTAERVLISVEISSDEMLQPIPDHVEVFSEHIGPTQVGPTFMVRAWAGLGALPFMVDMNTVMGWCETGGLIYLRGTAGCTVNVYVQGYWEDDSPTI